MNIKILGAGCARCHELLKNTREAVKELSIEAKIEEVNDIKEILSYNVISTPALVIDEKVLSTGRALSKKEVAQIIKNSI